MRKKGIVVTLLLAVLCMVGLASCGTGHEDDTDKTDQVAEYIVTFQSNGGSAVQSQMIKEGQRATKPADPTKEGFEFKGWYKDQNLTSQWNFEVYTVLENITLYAKWEAISEVEKYSITYVSEHGTKPEDVAEATALPAELPVLTDEGYDFKGWYTTENFAEGSEAVAGATLTANITLYAKWEVKSSVEKYSITYISKHGTAPTNIAGATTLPAELPELEDVEGWHFVGWFLDITYSIPAEAGARLEENTTLYAKWEEVMPPAPNTYNITFNMHGHGLVPATLLSQTQLPNPLPEVGNVAGWKFVGWFLDSAYAIPAEAGATISSNTTLHAKWEVDPSAPPAPSSYTITFNMHEHGAIPATFFSQTQLPNPLPIVIDEEGWHFVGWYLDAAYTTSATPGATISADTTLHAKWEAISEVEKYSITYVTEYGTAPTKVNDVTALPSTFPTLTGVAGYTFIAWYTTSTFDEGTEAIPGMPITTNTTLYAKWEQNFYSISYNINGKGNQPTNIEKASHLPEELPVLTDSTQSFAGWYLDANFNKKATAGMLLTEDVTLYAKWVDKTAIVISEAQGYAEGAYLEWNGLDGCDDYHVYYKKTTELDTQYKKIDSQLIREYPTNYRADVVGLAAGNYTVKVVPVYDETEYSSGSAEENVVVTAHDRSGFGFSKNSTYKTASGAYNDDGTLKSNAKVIYVSANNAKTVTCTINGTEAKGIQAILEAKQKGDTTPLAIRFIGLIHKSDLDYIASAEEGLQVKGKNPYAEMNLTVEGIGEDATCKGFGFLIRNCGNVEFRNLAIMEQIDDAISIDTSNCNLWIHNLDLYYGQAGGDSDQAKGDGFIDIKKSQYCSVSYNHFYDSGKSCLIDASQASSGGSDYLTYHHNWFDHSDSRHPRVRNAKNVHIYNNYYDGVSKYGVGATTGSSTFVEANYFRNVKYPMMIAGQGSDIDPKNSKGTFSNEAGGMIKAYNNKIVEGGTFISQNESSTSFDAVDVANRNDKVTAYSCLKGGGTYSNFDTDASIMYSYTPDDVDDVVNIVTTYAGRINGGDFHWTFNNAVEDENYSVIPELKQAIVNYSSTLIRVLGIEGIQNGGSTGEEEGGDDDSGTGENNPPAITGSVTHNFTTEGKDSSVFTITGNLSTSKGTVSYKGLTLTQCLKLESSTNVNFNINEAMTLVLVFAETSATIKVDGTKYTATNGIVTVSLAAGSHTVTKADTANLFYIELGKSA